MKVHDSDDVNAIRLDAIQETIRKLWDKEAPDPPTQRCAGRRRFGESFVRFLNGGDEVESEALCFALLELSGGNELGLRFGMKLNAPHRSVERAFLTTFSAGIPAIFPDLSSSRRRSASCSHSFSTSASTF